MGERVGYPKSDVSSLADMQAVAALGKEKFGRINAVFANAGIMPAGTMSELRVADWTRMVNVIGVLNAWRLSAA